jgi:hypothetical protein
LAGNVPLLPRGAVTRQFDTPEFRGITFHEVTARSALNKVPEASKMPFRWTINPYRGCSHSCVYCSWGDTLVLMADGRAKRLSDVRAGDRVIGTEVRGRYHRYVVTDVHDQWQTGPKRAYRLTLANGTTLVASGDHRFLTGRGWKHVIGAMSGVGQRPHLTTSHSLLGFGAMVESPKHDEDYRLGYLTGMIRGDAHLAVSGGSDRSTSCHFRLALTDMEGLDRTSEFLAEFGVETIWRPFGPDKPGDRPMTAISNRSKRGYDTIHALISWPSDPSEQWQHGFLAGIFDAEGSHSRGILRIANTDPVIIAATARALRRLDICRGNQRPSQRPGVHPRHWWPAVPDALPPARRPGDHPQARHQRNGHQERRRPAGDRDRRPRS